MNSTPDKRDRDRECVCVRERESACQPSKKFVLFSVKVEQIEFELLFCSGMRMKKKKNSGQRLKSEILSLRLSQ